MNKQEIGNAILTERKKQKLSQKALAEKIGLTRYQSILEIENGTFNYGIDVLIKVINALGIILNLIIPFSEETEESNATTSFKVFDFSKVEIAKEEDNENIKQKALFGNLLDSKITNIVGMNIGSGLKFPNKKNTVVTPFKRKKT